MWGCVGLLPNSNSKRSLSGQLTHWREFVNECGTRKLNYRTLAAANAGVDEDGFLKIGWPKPVEGSSLLFNALLAVATKPTRNHSGFIAPQDIADEWKTPCGKREVRYFWNNRKHGICTYQDKEIENHLLGPDCSR